MQDRKILAAVCLADRAAGRHIESHPAQRPGRLISWIPGTMASGPRLADGGDRS